MGPERTDPAAAERPEIRTTWRHAAVLVAPLLYVAGTAATQAHLTGAGLVSMLGALAIALHGARAAARGTADRVRPHLWTTAALSLSVATIALAERLPQVALLREAALVGAILVAARQVIATDGDVGLAARASTALAARSVALRRGPTFAMTASALAWAVPWAIDAIVWTKQLASGAAEARSSAASTAAIAGGLVALSMLGLVAVAVASARRFELAARPRALASAALAALGLVVSLIAIATTALRADAIVALVTACTCAAIVRVTRARDPLALLRRGRRALTLVLIGGAIAIVGALVAEGREAGVGVVVLVFTTLTMLVGALAPSLEEPFLPEKGTLLEALADATTTAAGREPRAAITGALLRLREACGREAPSPEIWLLYPTRVCTTDAAGYLQERPAELPPLLLDVLRGEPLGTARVDVLAALEVRQPELRPLLHWLEDRGALMATLIVDSTAEEPDGVVLVPRGARAEPLTLEEVHAAKRFADGFVVVAQARSARERHLERERALGHEIEALDHQLAARAHAASLDGSRNALATARLARPATVGTYSAASRMAYDAIERRVVSAAPVVVIARAGVDPVPILARAHLAGPRKERPFVIVDGTSSDEHRIDRWADPDASPLALANLGLLVLVDGVALPHDVQALIARTLAERRPPWERAAPLDFAIALTVASAPSELATAGALAPELFAWFEEVGPIALPGLAERAEDLFSLIADRLAREGLRVRGAPIGIEPAAFARLVEHPFEGEDAELAALVTRLVRRASGNVIRAADVDALGLSTAMARGEPGCTSGVKVRHRTPSGSSPEA